MNKHQKIKIFIVTVVLLFIFSLHSEASTLELALDKNITSAKEDINVLVTINSEGQDINTAQATISFPSNLLEVIKIDRADTVFTFWLEEPSYDNTKGSIRFVGGSTSNFNGPSLKVMKISFKVKGSGSGRLGVTDGAITASDGTGSNVYTTAKGLDINIPVSADFQAVQVEREQKAITLAKKLPISPLLDVPYYPDPAKWNNHSASFQANWKIDSDITKAGVVINNKLSFDPKESNEALSGHKIFSSLTDGIWYLHLRTANNIGWGQTTHYRIALDTTPPSSFKIISDDGFKTNNPKPTINFISSDSTSGIDNYIIRLDGKIASSTNITKYQFEPLPPGIHRLMVSAVDKAGNSTSQSEILEILPIASPIISYVSRSVIVDEAGITAGGKSLPKTEIIIQIHNSQLQNIFEQISATDINGNWNIVINKNLSIGDYYLYVTARDENMAMSLPVISSVIKVKAKPMLILGSLEITQTWFYIYSIIILLCSFGFGWLSFHKWEGKLDRRLIVASRDVVNIIDNTKDDIDKLSKIVTNEIINEGHLAEMKYILDKIKQNLEKSKKYIIDNMREINKK